MRSTGTGCVHIVHSVDEMDATRTKAGQLVGVAVVKGGNADTAKTTVSQVTECCAPT